MKTETRNWKIKEGARRWVQEQEECEGAGGAFAKPRETAMALLRVVVCRHASSNLSTAAIVTFLIAVIQAKAIYASIPISPPDAALS
eukprot:6177946-Pleurochrysis_carterae.AAC.1